MIYKRRELRRLWRIYVYDGDPNDPDGCSAREETVIAFNAVEANRKSGGVLALQPEALHYVTWDDEPLRIDSTAGPTREVIQPTLGN